MITNTTAQQMYLSLHDMDVGYINRWDLQLSGDKSYSLTAANQVNNMVEVMKSLSGIDCEKADLMSCLWDEFHRRSESGID